MNLVKTKHWLVCLFLLSALSVPARTISDAGNPLLFFTTVADKMLRSTFPFGVTNIPVCSNGVYVYTPAVQRLLQLSANILDASNTNTFPSVFRPLFTKDASNNIFICGYTQVVGVNGLNDPQLAAPYDATMLMNYTGTMPIADANGPVNVYGVPWIIGAKKGFPNFNQLSMVAAASISRKLEVTRTSTDVYTANYATNQMYIFSISNNLGISFWNSYSSNYPRPVTVCASDSMSMTLTNGANTWTGSTNFSFAATVNSWPGAHWTGTAPNYSPNSASFINTNCSFNFLPTSVYRFGTASFEPITSPTASSFEFAGPSLQLPSFGLSVTNYFSAYILDGSNVIDCVQLNSPVCSGNLNQPLADPNYPDPSSAYYQWSTNNWFGFTMPSGIVNQLQVSMDSSKAPTYGGQWSIAPTPMGTIIPSAEAAYFLGFFVPTFQYQGLTYINNQLSMQAPYTPTRTVYSSVLLQANDPLVHYLASDLNGHPDAASMWASHLVFFNGAWSHSDSLTLQPFPIAPTTPIGGRFQPWLRKGQMDALSSSIPVTNNYGVKDPLVYISDNWNFPSNLLSSLSSLGQVHRGTPWQTVYLKDVNFLLNYTVSGLNTNNVGTNTWMDWTGDLDAHDAALMAPVMDRSLAGLLMSVLNTNDPTQLQSVNDSSVTDWQNLLNGLTLYSNSSPAVTVTTPLTYNTIVVDGASTQASMVANGIVQVQQSGQSFRSIGDVFFTPELSRKSPFLNLGSSASGQQQMNFGISDWEYEAIPAQLLPLLRPDSIGAMTSTNSGWQFSFSGADGYAYVLQSSTNLTDWISESTNYPMAGSIVVPFTGTNSMNRFYRTVLQP